MLPADTLALLEEADVILASDEAGYGAYAGPVVVGAVAAPKDWVPSVPITDSKKMSDADRRAAAKAIIADDRIIWLTLWTQAPEIDATNVYRANIRLHTHAVESGIARAQAKFPGKAIMAVVDGNLEIPGALSLPKADLRVVACSAASILAKVARDTWMIEKMDVEHPGYGFRNHVGYGTPEHTAALEKLGPCPIHRRSFGPIARLASMADSQVLTKARVVRENIMDLIAEMADQDSR